LSARCLESVFGKIVNSGCFTLDEIYVDRQVGRHEAVLSDMRKLQRHVLLVPLTIYERINPELKGSLHDVTEEGLGISGFQARVGETRSFVVPCRPHLDIDAIRLDAKCIWSLAESNPEECKSGFQVIDISPEHAINLRELILQPPAFR